MRLLSLSSLSMLAVACALLACENEQKKLLSKLNKQSAKLHEEYYLKELWYPVDSGNVVLNVGTSAVVYYDASCSSCFQQLEVWKKELDSIPAPQRPAIRFVLGSNDSVATMRELEQFHFPLKSVVLDTKYEFIKRYPFAAERAFNAILVDIQQRILLIGSPLVSPGIKKRYRNELLR